MKDYTKIVLLVDASGSMGSCISDTIGSFNGFIEDQQKVGSNADVTLITFNGEWKEVYRNRNIAEIPLLTTEDYRPRGMTALYKTVADWVEKVGLDLASLNESDRPNKVMFVVITDGENTVYADYQESAKTRVQHQTEVYNWNFVFLGADLNVTNQARTIGIANAFNYNGNTKEAYMNLRHITTNFRRS